MPTEAPRPGETAYRTVQRLHGLPEQVDRAHLLEQLAQVEHQLEALGRYSEELRERVSKERKVEHSKGRGTCAP